MMTRNMNNTTLFGTIFAALLIAVATTANAQGFDGNRRPEPNRGMPQQQQQFGNNRSAQPVAMPQTKPATAPQYGVLQHGAPQFGVSQHNAPQHGTTQKYPAQNHQQHQQFQDPRHHAYNPAPVHQQPTMNLPKPAPFTQMHVDHHCTPAPQPQVVVVGQPPRKPSLLEKIVDIFR